MNEFVKLSEVATVELSNVDKKSKEKEKTVRLCNFTDVYYNWSITENLPFMEATASDEQIENLSLKKGQVALTKDSETRDDIGMPSYVAEDLKETVLGYHCVLITPNKNLLDGSYLNALLNTDYARKYFSNNASGSGQRYTLSKESIESFPVPILDIETQHKIGEFFQNIDSKLMLNNLIIAELESSVVTLFNYWFLQFDFPNHEGNPYRQSGGKLKWNKDLKMEIPEKWESIKISDLAQLYQPEIISFSELNDKGKYFVYGANGIVGKFDKYNHEKNEIAISCRGSCGQKVMTLPKSWITGNAMIISPFDEIWKEFIYYYIQPELIKPYITGSVQPQITRENLSNFVLLKPDFKTLSLFNEIALEVRKEIINKLTENNELISCRDWLLPLLLNGQVSVS